VDNSDAWDALFISLWPIAYGVAHARLGIAFPDEVEDVAIETLEVIVGKSSQVKAFDEFPKLTRTIASNLAISRSGVRSGVNQVSVLTIYTNSQKYQ
jgi:DNA-directed RNA polymerase specialized sigma24 family protein